MCKNLRISENLTFVSEKKSLVANHWATRPNSTHL